MEFKDSNQEFLITVSLKGFNESVDETLFVLCFHCWEKIGINGTPANESCKDLSLHKILVSPNESSLLLWLFRKYSALILHRNKVFMLLEPK